MNPVVQDDGPKILNRIHERGVALAIWKRASPNGLAEWLGSLAPEQLPAGRFVSTIEHARSGLSTLCDIVGLAGPQRELLIDDVTTLVRAFGETIGRDRVDIRLEAVDHDSCWRFHHDYVGFRLNATYRGPGTQWPPLAHAERAARAQRGYGGPLNEVAPFSAALFKGVKLAGKSALLHRSPPVAGRSVTRLLLCLNEEDDD
ncbi:MAG: DUF1826 domain-containing protein [Alphaproteobacteria bacterium]|nr:DUF1826 domain-containing protein [Alphaproteobacteria bacterium]